MGQTSHGPIFEKDDALLDAAIKRVGEYCHMADFGTCAVDWPMMDEFEDEIAAGKMPLQDNWAQDNWAPAFTQSRLVFVMSKSLVYFNFFKVLVKTPFPSRVC